MSTISTYRSRSNLRKKRGRLWLSVVLVLGLVLASISVVAAQAHAGSFSDEFPKQVLMKGGTQLQDGYLNYGDWHWYEDGQWNGIYADYGPWPHAVVVRAGSKLHIRINKPERPAIYRIRAYKQDAENPGWPVGKGRVLNTTFKRVERDGKTVGWNVFFRVNQPDRHYYLESYGRWARVPGTHISYGIESLHYHLKTSE